MSAKDCRRQRDLDLDRCTETARDQNPSSIVTPVSVRSALYCQETSRDLATSLAVPRRREGDARSSRVRERVRSLGLVHNDQTPLRDSVSPETHCGFLDKETRAHRDTQPAIRLIQPRGDNPADKDFSVDAV